MYFDCPTSKFTSEQHLHAQIGPTIFNTASLFSFWMVNLGRYGCQSWMTYPMGIPSGASTSSCKRSKIFLFFFYLKQHSLKTLKTTDILIILFLCQKHTAPPGDSMESSRRSTSAGASGWAPPGRGYPERVRRRSAWVHSTACYNSHSPLPQRTPAAPWCSSPYTYYLSPILILLCGRNEGTFKLVLRI